jgi:hypothetical protein
MKNVNKFGRYAIYGILLKVYTGFALEMELVRKTIN